jgi:tetratricopeptide (TPR) repeat protein
MYYLLHMPRTSRRPVRPVRRRLAASGLFLATAALVGAGPVPQVPALPELPWEAYPAETRAAIEPVYKAAVARPRDAAAAGTLARTLQAWHELEAAHQTYRRAQALAPAAFEWRYLDGIVLQRLARHAEAAAALRRALAVAPTYLPARVKLADSLLRSGQLDASATLYTALLSQPPAEPFARFGLGRIAALQHKHGDAVTHFTRAVELFPEWGEAHYALAMSLLALKRRDEAAAALAAHTRFGRTVPGLEDPVLARTASVRNDAATNFERGVKLKVAGDLQGAIEAHEAAAALDPAYAQAHANLISLHSEAGNWAQVEEHYRAVVALGFGLADANFDYGVAHERQGHWNLAEAAYRRAIAIQSDHTPARINLGRALERKRDFAGAADEFRRAIESRPADRLAHYDLARMLVNLGKPHEAIPEFELALEPSQNSAPAVLLGLAVAHALAGQGEASERRFAEARAAAQRFDRPDLMKAIAAARASLAKRQR